MERSSKYCQECSGPLWQADRNELRRYAPAEFIKRHLKGFFDFYIADEVHELKGADTAQGNAFGMLASVCGKTVCLTGTLVGGYASHLFYLLYRLSAKRMRGEDLKYSQVHDYVSRYGTVEYIRRTKVEDGELTYARGKKRTSERIKYLPGISPLAFARHLLSSTVFVELADVAEYLPAFREDVCTVDMSMELADGYKEIEKLLKAAMKNPAKRQRLLGIYLMTLLSYPDRPYDNAPIPEVGQPRELSRTTIYPKEEALLEFVKAEVKENRHVWVFATFTNRRDVTGRLLQLFKSNGIKATVLKQDTVTTQKREEWITEQVEQGFEVIISNPELVKTGLDLLSFPSLAFYETGYNTFTLMQASRRSWRIGQTRTVKVRYFCYKGTMQEAALRLMGAKVKASQALQGKFSAEGLVALTQGEDMMSALAKILMNGIDGVDTAETYWRNDRKAGKGFAGSVVPAKTVETDRPDPAPVKEKWTTLDLFGGLGDLAPPPRRPAPASGPQQLQLELAA